MFAYLPLRSYGFRFIIQGDFEVPSSREDVDKDKSWNQWLREEIPQLFVDALSIFMVGTQNYLFLLMEYRLVSFCLLNLPLRYFASLRHPLLFVTDLRFISIIAAKTCLRQSTSNRLLMNRAQN